MIQTGIKPEQILFFDIETSAVTNTFEEYQEKYPQLAKAYIKKVDDFKTEDWPHVALKPEHSRIVCITAGLYDPDTGFRVKSYADENELDLITQFFTDLERLPKQIKYICGHNVKEFDIPFVIKRSVLWKIPLNRFFQTYGKKPWELDFIIDTMEIWRCGSFKGYAGLELLAAFFNLENPKEHTEEQSVHQMWHSGDVKSICAYCEADVFTTARIYCRIAGFDDIKLAINTNNGTNPKETTS